MNSATTRPIGGSRQPLANNLTASGDPIAIGPFSTAGTFHFYCTIHPGMNLVVAIQ